MNHSSRGGVEGSVGLLGVNEQGSQHHEGLEHGSDVEDGLVVVALGKNRRQLVADDGGEVHHRHVARKLRSAHFRPCDPHHERIGADGNDGPEEGVDDPHEHHEPAFAPEVVKRAPNQRGQGGTKRRIHQHGFPAESASKFTPRHGTEHGDDENDTALGGVEFFLAPTQFLKEEERENGDENEGQ